MGEEGGAGFFLRFEAARGRGTVGLLDWGAGGSLVGVKAKGLEVLSGSRGACISLVLRISSYVSSTVRRLFR